MMNVNGISLDANDDSIYIKKNNNCGYNWTYMGYPWYINGGTREINGIPIWINCSITS